MPEFNSTPQKSDIPTDSSTEQRVSISFTMYVRSSFLSYELELHVKRDSG